MSRTFELPDPGEGIGEAEVIEIPVAAGAQVEESEILLTVETDKAAVEIPSPFTGWIEEILVAEGDDVEVGQGVLIYETQKVDDDEAATDEHDEVTDREKADATSGTAEDLQSDGRDAEDAEAVSEPDTREGPVPAAPATRRRARELGVDLRDVEGSGPGGRVTDEDVEAAAGDPGTMGPEGEEPEPAAGEEAEREDAGKPESKRRRRASPYTDPERWGPVEREPLRSVRRTTARRMADAWRRIPHVTHMDHADVTELEELRRTHADAVSEEGGDLSLTVFVLKALVAALKEYPRFNARLDDEAEEVVLLGYHHIGVAVDTDRGLLVPVVRDVESKSLTELSVELSRLVAEARARGLTREQFQGGSFTLTNPGPLGGDAFTPIINPPQVAILGTARAERRPTVRGAEDGPPIEPRLILPLCVAFDHRVNDGADAARFTNRLVEILEDPAAFVRHL